MTDNIVFEKDRPGEANMTWADISKDIWTKTDEQYFFKKSHSISYAVLVALHMKLLDENLHTREQ